jgi:histidinol-phosphate phosphatase family protein
MTNRAVFLDRDGTMAKDVNYCARPEDFELFPNTAKAIKLLHEHGLKVIVVTNQSGIARGYFTEETLAQIHEKMKAELAKESAWVDGIYYCPHHPTDNCDCRKPKPKLVLQAAKEYDIDLKHSFVVGDLEIDIGLGKAVGCHTILISPNPGYDDQKQMSPDYTTFDLYQAARWIVSQR